MLKILNRKPAKNTIIKVTRAYSATIARLMVGRSLKKLVKREIKVIKNWRPKKVFIAISAKYRNEELFLDKLFSIFLLYIIFGY